MRVGVDGMRPMSNPALSRLASSRSDTGLLTQSIMAGAERAKSPPLWMRMDRILSVGLGLDAFAHRLGPGTAASVEVDHLSLQVVLQSHALDLLELGFEEVDVLLRVVEDALEQVA